MLRSMAKSPPPLPGKKKGGSPKPRKPPAQLLSQQSLLSQQPSQLPQISVVAQPSAPQYIDVSIGRVGIGRVES